MDCNLQLILLQYCTLGFLIIYFFLTFIELLWHISNKLTIKIFVYEIVYLKLFFIIIAFHVLTIF